MGPLLNRGLLETVLSEVSESFGFTVKNRYKPPMTDISDRELSPSHPGTPAQWTQILTGEHAGVRRVVFRFARSRGAFMHATTIHLQPAPEVTFRVELEEGDALLPLDGHRSARSVIEHGWAELCSVGLVYAAKHDLTRLRGEMACLDETGALLNDPGVSRKVLNLSTDGLPSTEDDDELSVKDASLLAQLRHSQKRERSLQNQLDSCYRRDEERAEKRIELENMHAAQVQNLGQGIVDFADYKAGVIRRDLEQMAGEFRIDFVTEEIMKVAGPRIGNLMDAAAVWLRTGGGRQADARRVPNMPADVLLWVMDVYGAANYMELSSEVLKASKHPPGEPGYRQRWADVLSLLDGSLSQEALGEHTVPESVAKRLEDWGIAALQALEGDPHRWSRICFATRTATPDARPDESPEEGESSAAS